MCERERNGNGKGKRDAGEEAGVSIRSDDAQMPLIAMLKR